MLGDLNRGLIHRIHENRRRTQGTGTFSRQDACPLVFGGVCWTAWKKYIAYFFMSVLSILLAVPQLVLVLAITETQERGGRLPHPSLYLRRRLLVFGCWAFAPPGESA